MKQDQTFKAIKAQDCKVGQQLPNIGHIEKIELFPVSKLVAITCTEQKVMSAAFYWYRYDTILFVTNE